MSLKMPPGSMPNIPPVPGGFPIPPAMPAARQKNQRPLLPHQVLGMRAHGPLGDQILQRAFPVGCIYISTVATNPGDDSIFGFGTWVAFGAGRTLIGVGTSDQAFSAGVTGGESNHTLTVTEMPSHQHNAIGNTSTIGGNSLTDHTGGSNTGNPYPTSSTGGGGAHNNLPPYIVVYFWQRTA